MGTVRDMAHSSDMINHEARQRVELLSSRAPEPPFMYDHRRKASEFWGAMFCLAMATLFVVTWIFFL